MKAVPSRILKSAALAAAVLPLPFLFPAPAPAARAQAPRYRFYDGSAKSRDVDGPLWLAMGEGKSSGLFGDPLVGIVLRLAGKSRSSGSLTLNALHPESGQKVGSFKGKLRRGKIKGSFSAAGRVGKWSAEEVKRDAAGMTLLAGTYVERKSRTENREIRIELDAASGIAEITATRRGEVSQVSGPWMAGKGALLCLLPKDGDGTLGGLVPSGLSARGMALIVEYRVEGDTVRVLNPFDRSNVLATLDRQPDPAP